MKIRVKLYGDFLRFGAEDGSINLGEEDSVEDLLNKLGISERSYIIVFVNMKRAWFEQKLSDGDVVSIFSPVGGG